MLLKLLRISRSHNPEKKLDAVFEKDNGRTKSISFGAKGYEDFTTHHDEERKNRYLKRHNKHEDWNKPDSAGALSRWILWNKSTVQSSIRDYKSKFGL
jgi:hypothetical protein